jgi:hypothetical protein
MQWLRTPNNAGIFDDHRCFQRYALAVLYYALAVLYYSTRGESWSLSRFWLTCANECDWYLEGTGIQSCHADGNIITIALAENNLDGPLPRELALLSRSLGEYRALTLARFSDIIKEQQNSLKQ